MHDSRVVLEHDTCQTNSETVTQAYWVGKYPENRQRLDVSLKRNINMGSGKTATRTIREADFAL